MAMRRAQRIVVAVLVGVIGLAIAVGGLVYIRNHKPAAPTATPAPSPNTRASPVASVTPSPVLPYVAQVQAFYTAYAGASNREERQAVIDRYTTAELAARLKAASGMDGVLCVQNTPDAFTYAQGDSGAGHTHVVVTEHFGAAPARQIQIQLRLEDKLIDDLRCPGQ